MSAIQTVLAAAIYGGAGALASLSQLRRMSRRSSFEDVSRAWSSIGTTVHAACLRRRMLVHGPQARPQVRAERAG